MDFGILVSGKNPAPTVSSSCSRHTARRRCVVLSLMGMLGLPLVLACAHLLRTRFDTASGRVNATVDGLQRYYLNATGSYYTCCGQTGGSGGAAPFGCACGQADMTNCLHCYRWWATQGLQAFIEAEQDNLKLSLL